MGVPRFGWSEIPLSIPVEDTRAVPIDVTGLNAGLPGVFSAVNVGNPHAIFFVDDVNAHAIERTGPILEKHPLFPERVNVSFVAVQGRATLSSVSLNAVPASLWPAAPVPARRRSPRCARGSATGR